MSERSWFESQYNILDGHFLHWFVVKIVLFVWKDDNKQKEADVGPLLKKEIDKETKCFLSNWTTLIINGQNQICVWRNHALKNVSTGLCRL